METIWYITGGLLVPFFGYVFYSWWKMKKAPMGPESEKIRNLDDKNFSHQVGSGIALVDFWASWCMPCRMMTPVLNEVAEEVDSSVRICKVNIEQHQSIANRFSVKNIPTMLIFRNGKEVDRIVGVKSKDFLIKKLNMLKYK